MRQSDGGRAWIRRAIAGSGVAIAILVIVELVLRMTVQPAAFNQRGIVGWNLAPGLTHAPIQRRESRVPFHVSTNADGLRSSLPRQRQEGRRIAMLGDSQVFGWGVEDEETLPARLEAALRNPPGLHYDETGEGATLTARLMAYARGRLEVLNAGQPGYSTEQMRRLFTDTVVHYQPDVVVLCQTWHDFNSAEWTDREALANPAPRLRGWLWNWSFIYRSMDRVLRPPEPKPPSLLAWALPGRIMRVPPEQRAEARDAIRAAASGAPLIIVLLPNEVALRHPTLGGGYDPLSSEVKAYGAQRGVTVLDLRRTFAEGPPIDEVTVSGDPGHFNRKGADILAAALAPVVKAALEQQ